MTEKWFSALKRGDNGYFTSYLSENWDALLIPDESGNFCLAVAISYKNTGAIDRICGYIQAKLNDSPTDERRNAILALLQQGMETCLKADEGIGFCHIRPCLFAAGVATKYTAMDLAIEMNAYSIVHALLENEDYGIEFLMEKQGILQLAQSKRLADIFKNHLSAARTKVQLQSSPKEAELPAHTSQKVEGQAAAEASEAKDKKTKPGAGVASCTLTDEWMTQASRAILCETIKNLQTELSKEREQTKKYQNIISSIINDDRQSQINYEKQIQSLNSQLSDKIQECEERARELGDLKQLLASSSIMKPATGPSAVTTLTPQPLTIDMAVEAISLRDSFSNFRSEDLEAAHQQVLSEYSSLKPNLVNLGLESSIITQNVEKVTRLTEIAQAEIKALKQSCVDAINEAAEIRDRLTAVQSERDALNTELQRLKEMVDFITSVEGGSNGQAAKQSVPTASAKPDHVRTERSSESIPLVGPESMPDELHLINNMTIQSYFDDEENGKDEQNRSFAPHTDSTNMYSKRLIEKLEEYAIHVDHTGTDIVLRITDAARFCTLLPDPAQPPNASIFYPSELSVANFCQMEPAVELSEAVLADPRLHPEVKKMIIDMQRHIARLTAELDEKNQALAELGGGRSQMPLTAEAANSCNSFQKLDEVACLLYQRAICERDQVIRTIEAQKASVGSFAEQGIMTQKKEQSILPREEELLRKLFSQASLHHNLIQDSADAIWLDVLTMALQSRNYHLSEYLKIKLITTSNVLHEQYQRGATLHGFVSLNNLAAVYLLAPYVANIRDANGRTALMVAAELDKLDIVRVLIPYEAGAQTVKGHTALMIAAQLGYLRIVRELSGLEGHICDQRGRSVIYYATEGSVFKDSTLSSIIVDVLKEYIPI